MKKFRKLIPALALLLVSAVLMSTASYAWFSMNNKVTVTGMEVKTKVSNNLLIAPMDLSTTAPSEDAYKTSYVTTLKAILEPVSTTTGTAFFYTSTKNVTGSGDAISNTYIAYDASATATDQTNYSNAFSENYGVTKTDANGYPSTRAEGYIDYIFALKAQNTGTTANYVNITSIGLTYGGTDSTEKAFRTAIFVEDLGTSDSRNTPTTGVGTLKVILAPDSAVNFTAGEAVTSTSATGAVAYGGASTIGSVAGNTTHYYKVVVRLWLEGEDKSCNNTTFAALNDQWALDLTIELNGTNNGNVAVLGKTSGTKTDLQVGTAVTSNTVLIDAITYYEINSATLGTGENAPKLYKSANTAVAATDRIFTIVDNHPIDVTNQINFTPAS